MMKRVHTILTFGVALICASCSSPDPAITAVTVNPSVVAPGGEIIVSVTVADFELRDPRDVGGSHGLRAADDGNEHGDATDYPSEGHFHVYFDTIEANPLQLDCPDYCMHPGFTPNVRATISSSAAVGLHEVIVLLNNNAHMTLMPHIRGTADLTVQ
ncbi:MAG: hypothetical protein RL846_05100 [Deltaproteobacteria bacterium]|jgi:hypothetical protein